MFTSSTFVHKVITHVAALTNVNYDPYHAIIMQLNELLCVVHYAKLLAVL